MRALAILLAFSLSGAAIADDMADANQALLAKSYPRAVQLYTQLATAGNNEARLRLGEMYWYGEGVAVDRARADALFAQAAAGGNTAAASAITLTPRRAQRSADIAYWTAKYDGADLRAGKFDCAAPAIPAVSKDNKEINKMAAAINAWNECYKGFIGNIADASPAGKRIPADVLELMTEAEVQQAIVHLDKVYAATLADAKGKALPFLAQRDAWQQATIGYVTESNKVAELSKQWLKAELEMSGMTTFQVREPVRIPPVPSR